jgi:hypothetical protein
MLAMRHKARVSRRYRLGHKMQVLNRVLYSKLRRHFGGVRVSCAGEAMICRATRSLEGDPRLTVFHAGEYYQICCPYCDDTRFRLYINHRFGTKDVRGRPLTFLAICYNESCMSKRENLYDFLERLDELSLTEANVSRGKIVPEEAREVLPPGPCVSLTDLPAKHPAIAYLRSRRFDIAELGTKHLVSYCFDSRYTLAKNRLIIPVYEKGKLKGWQARYPGELDWKGPKKKELPPKYFSCPGSHFRSRCIYGFETMPEWETGILVEGPTDRWRFGSMAGSIFGNSVTAWQMRKFLAVFSKRTGVLLLDPEEMESKKTIETLDLFRKKMPGQFCGVVLPEDTDPGGLDRDFVKEYVRQHASRQGVRVRYRKIGKE